MKKVLIVIIFSIIILPLNINATGGALRKATIKTCPNGITYGLHGDGEGGTHWHISVTNGTNYYPDGEAIINDPCPGYKKNEGTAGSTDTTTQSSSNSENDNSTSDSGIKKSNGNVSSKNNTKTDTNVMKKNNNENIKNELNSDNTIRKINIDGKEISIFDNMSFETEKKHVNIQATANNSKAKIEFENKELLIGENIVNLVVTAENGDKKTYVLTINRIKSVGTATIEKFILGNENIKFKENKAIFSKSKKDSSFDYSYKLNDPNAKLKMYLNEKETSKLDSLKENDKIKLIVLDENENENIYEIKIEDYPAAMSIIVNVIYVFVLVFLFISPIAISLIVIILLKKKQAIKPNKKENNLIN